MRYFSRMIVGGVLTVLTISCHVHRNFPRPIPFEESESIVVSDEIAKGLGFEKLTVAPGNYQVTFDSADKFGLVVLQLEEATPALEAVDSARAPDPDRFGIRIKIASRKKNCDGGIGFRCGLISHPSETGPTYATSIRISGRSLLLKFQEPIPWDELKQNPQP